MKVKAVVWTAYSISAYDTRSKIAYEPAPNRDGNMTKKLYRQEVLQFGIVVGKTKRATGYYCRESDYSAQLSWLSMDKWHEVWLVEEMHTEKWHEPMMCLESDLEVIE